jgi:hypothetical protein
MPSCWGRCMLGSGRTRRAMDQAARGGLPQLPLFRIAAMCCLG